MMTIKGFSCYAVTEDGKVYSLITGREMCSVVTRVGYEEVMLKADGMTWEDPRKHCYVHRLVADAYIPNPLGLPEVNHIDGDKLHNCVENLEWVTHAENQRKAAAGNAWRALTEAQEKEVVEKAMAGAPYGVLAKEYGVSHACINQCTIRAGIVRTRMIPIEIRREIFRRGQVEESMALAEEYRISYQTIRGILRRGEPKRDNVKR